jgi:hypothetical protein
MRSSLDQTRFKLTTCVQTQTDLMSKWVRVEEIAEGSTMHRRNESARPELQMRVGAWIMEAQERVDGKVDGDVL